MTRCQKNMAKQNSESALSEGEAIRVTGTVQGVGFRPTVWRLARQHGLRGAVWNDAQGVLIHVWGKQESLECFVQSLSR